MNDFPAFDRSGPLKVIRDRIGSRYLSSWSGPENAPETFTWDNDILQAHHLTPAQAHMLRAGILATEESKGGLPETHVAIMDLASARALSSERSLNYQTATADKVMLHHPLQGWYIKHAIDGDRVRVTWNSQQLMGQIMSQVEAENIREVCGIPALMIVPVKLSEVMQASLPEMKQLYHIIKASDTEGLTTLVNVALRNGAQIAGGIAVHASGDYLQAVVLSGPMSNP